MLETVDPQLLENVDLPPRIERLRARFFSFPPAISIFRARAFTQVARENPALPTVLLNARSFYRACETLPIYIGPDELIVGHPGGQPRAGIFSPEICWRWLDRELDTVGTRPQDPYFVSEADQEILRTEIFPFWRGRSVDEYISAELEELGLLALAVQSGVMDCEVKSTSGGGDLSPGYANVLFTKGYAGIKQDAQARLAQLDLRDHDDIERCHFLKSLVIVCDALALLAGRYADLADALALEAASLGRAEELRRIATVCRRVPAEPPRTLHEALQAIWFGQVALFLEENTSGPSPGRVDQYLYPFFERDLASGVLDRSAAQELLLCFLLKFNEIPWLLSESGARYFAGYMPFMNICVGGQTPNGRDASNELSYLLLDCVRRLRMYQPSLAARVHNASPPEFLRAIAEVVRAGLGFPALHFDDPTIKMLLAEGIPVEDARDYCIMGCVEPYVHGKMARWSSAVYTNFPIAIEFALTDGRHRATDQILGARTGDPRSFASFEDFLDAVRQQLRHILDASATATVVAQAAHRLHLPKPVSSALVIGCLESGRDITAGGAHYNCGPGVICVGLADHANSLAAIKHLVYDTGAVSMAELCAALDADFQGYSVLHKKCLDAPKYGNDDDTVDLLAVEALDFMAAELGRRRGLYAKLELGTLSVTTNIPQGLAIGALPSGRKAAEPLADGISPVAGSDRLGPTAAIKSVDKLNQEVSTVGTLFNMKLDPRLLADDLGVANFIALIRTHNQLGGAQIQFNCVSAADLLDAQQHPEKHRHLIVRVSGYSAFFTELGREVQDDIIRRTLQTAW